MIPLVAWRQGRVASDALAELDEAERERDKDEGETDVGDVHGFFSSRLRWVATDF